MATRLLFAVVRTVLFLANGGNGTQLVRAHASRPTWLAGTPLRKPTHLRLLVSENGGPAFVVDVDDQSVQSIHGLGLPHNPSLWAPVLWPLSKVNGGVLAIVTKRNCNVCTGTETHYLIGPAGSVQRISELTLAPDQTSSTPVLGSTAASWVLTDPRRGRCTLRAEPGFGPAVTVPCGDLVADTAIGADTPAGLVISTSTRMLLVNLQTGARRHVRWPSVLRYGYEVFPEPHSSMAAVDFMDPAYAGAQASDLWLLNTRTGAFTHVPGFPILEYIKFSGLTWTTDHRLLIVAHGPRRTSLGIWQPGSHQLQVGTMPSLAGYTGLVAFDR